MICRGVSGGSGCRSLMPLIKVSVHILSYATSTTTNDGAHSSEFYNVSTGDSASSVLYS